MRELELAASPPGACATTPRAGIMVSMRISPTLTPLVVMALIACNQAKVCPAGAYQNAAGKFCIQLPPGVHEMPAAKPPPEGGGFVEFGELGVYWTPNPPGEDLTLLCSSGPAPTASGRLPQGGCFHDWTLADTRNAEVILPAGSRNLRCVVTSPERFDEALAACKTLRAL